MNKSFIIGYEKIEADFGYFPSFHDDVIEKIEISSEEITFLISMETLPNGMNSYPKVKLTFCEVNDFKLEGELYGCTSIIFDMIFTKIDNYIKTEIASSLGTCGTISSRKVKISLE